jgi:hypothetical protein
MKIDIRILLILFAITQIVRLSIDMKRSKERYEFFKEFHRTVSPPMMVLNDSAFVIRDGDMELINYYLLNYCHP